MYKPEVCFVCDSKKLSKAQVDGSVTAAKDTTQRWPYEKETALHMADSRRGKKGGGQSNSLWKLAACVLCGIQV